MKIFIDFNKQFEVWDGKCANVSNIDYAQETTSIITQYIAQLCNIISWLNILHIKKKKKETNSYKKQCKNWHTIVTS